MAEAIAARADAKVEEAVVDYNDPCWFFFTSGTTGRSKAAVLTHGQMAFVVTNHLADLMPGTTENDASLVVNMILKEASMSRYPDWAEYKKRSWWLLPPVL